MRNIGQEIASQLRKSLLFLQGAASHEQDQYASPDGQAGERKIKQILLPGSLLKCLQIPWPCFNNELSGPRIENSLFRQV